jgi:hypothetical protein
LQKINRQRPGLSQGKVTVSERVEQSIFIKFC